MKRIPFVDTSLLAEVEKESPAVFGNFISNPISRFTFVDYSIDDTPMLMQLEAYEHLQLFAQINFITMDETLDQLQIAYDLGYGDLFARLNKKMKEVDRLVEIQFVLLFIALDKYPLHDFDRFNQHLDAHIDLDSVSVAFKTAYMDALYYESWREVLKNHHLFEELFVKLNLLKMKNIKPEDMNFGMS